MPGTLATGLFSYFPFDGTLGDVHGSHDLTGSVTYNTPGKLGSNYLESGSPSVSGLNQANVTDATLACWFQFAGSQLTAVVQQKLRDETPADVLGLSMSRAARTVAAQVGGVSVI